MWIVAVTMTVGLGQDTGADEGNVGDEFGLGALPLLADYNRRLRKQPGRGLARTAFSVTVGGRQLEQFGGSRVEPSLHRRVRAGVTRWHWGVEGWQNPGDCKLNAGCSSQTVSAVGRHNADALKF